MGLPSFARAYLKRKYLSAFSFKRPEDPTVVIMDLMEFIKVVPENVHTLDDAVRYFVNRVKSELYNNPRLHTLIVLVDRTPPPVKRAVEHAKRYKNKDVFDAAGAPYLPVKGTDLVPSPWISFAGNYRLLQRELYGRLLNAFMDGYHLVPRPGQKLILHGFPGYMEYVRVYKQQAYAINTNDRGEVKQMHVWNTSSELPITEEMEKRDPDLYNRIFVFENVPPCAEWPQGLLRKDEWEGAKNSISESDGAMFYYDHFFERDTIMFKCNDGDVFAYGLLYGYERIIDNAFRNIHYVCLPYKKKTDNEIFAPGKTPSHEYVDLNKLYILICEDATMQSAEVQNHIVTMAFLLILAGSDFFKDFMKGLGAEKVIWGTFFKALPLFSHMVQLSKGVTASTRTPRTIILDEDLFRLFTHYCYLEKYGKGVEKTNQKKNKKKKTKKRKEEEEKEEEEDGPQITYKDLKLRCSQDAKGNPREDTDLHLPTRNTIRLWSRQVLWNLLYFKNAPFGVAPDPFELYDGQPYYPYVRDEVGGCKMIDFVCARQKPIDEVYSQHMYKTKRAKLSASDKETKKRRVIETFDK
jgi:hypothetical protein